MNKIIDALAEDIFFSLLLIIVGFLAFILVTGAFINSANEDKYALEMAKLGCTQTVAQTGVKIWDCRKDK
jgi:hypothetical protein